MTPVSPPRAVVSPLPVSGQTRIASLNVPNLQAVVHAARSFLAPPVRTGAHPRKTGFAFLQPSLARPVNGWHRWQRCQP